MELKEEIRRLKREIKELKEENQGLKKREKLQKAVIETVEEVNSILASDKKGKELLWTTDFPHNVSPEVALKIQKALKKNNKIWGSQQSLAKILGSNRQRVCQICTQNPSEWMKGDNTPKKNANQCSADMEALIVHLCKEDLEASYNLTAKHTAVITDKKVSAHLVKQVRKRNGLLKKKIIKKSGRQILSGYAHVVSMDVVREQGNHIFGMIRDGVKVTLHYLAERQTSAEAVHGLQRYIKQYGKPEAVRCDNGSEFRGEFVEFLKKEQIGILRPLPYNPGANGFIERYFRTLRKDLFRKLKTANLLVSQKMLDDFAFLWNHCRTLPTRGKTPGELAGLDFPFEKLKGFKVEQQKVSQWNFWHIEGIHSLMHVYLHDSMLSSEVLLRERNIA